jgi:hypothetical protein
MEELINETIDPIDDHQVSDDQINVLEDNVITNGTDVVQPVPNDDVTIQTSNLPLNPDDVRGSAKGGNCICSCDLTCTRA